MLTKRKTMPPSTRSSLEEYQVDQILALETDDAHAQCPSMPSPIRVRIRRLISETLSCTMVVDVLDDNLSVVPDLSPAFLKLYDRRFAVQHRRDNGVERWTREAEEAYTEGLRDGTVSEFLDDLHNTKNFQEDTEEDWDDPQIEAFLTDVILPLYETETKVYDALQEHQGQLIPKLLAAVTLKLSPPTPAAADKDEDSGKAFKLLHVKGILLQHIEGFDMWTMADHFPSSSWQDIVDQATAIVRVVGDHHILNRDVRPENFMVARVAEDAFKVFMIDFALCRFKRDNESDREWAEAKFTKDEEGAVGFVVKKRLMNVCGFQLHYERSFRYYAEAFPEEQGGDISAQ